MDPWSEKASQVDGTRGEGLNERIEGLEPGQENVTGGRADFSQRVGEIPCSVLPAAWEPVEKEIGPAGR